MPGSDPPSEALHEKWSWENGDVWGYVFNYMANELHFYNLKKWETYGPRSVKATLTSTDWAVLTLVSSKDLRATVVSEKAVHQETIVDALWSRSGIVCAMSMKPASKSKETQTVFWMCETVSPHIVQVPWLTQHYFFHIFEYTVIFIKIQHETNTLYNITTFCDILNTIYLYLFFVGLQDIWHFMHKTGVIFPETDVLSILQTSYLSASSPSEFSSPVPLPSAITTTIKSDLSN